MVKIQSNYENKVMKMVTNWEYRTKEIEESILNDVLGYQKKHKRNKIDIDSTVKKLEDTVQIYQPSINELERKILQISTILSWIIENLNVQMYTESQDNEDRKNVYLAGVKENNNSELMTTNILKSKAKFMKQMMNKTTAGFHTNRSQLESVKESGSQNKIISFQKPAITINTDWLSCSGHSSMILSGFKLACLNYSPSNFEYRMKVLTRDDAIVIRKYLLEKWINIIQNESFFTDNLLIPKR